MKVLITGASQGIGKAIAERFLNDKHTVIGIDRQPSSIDDNNYTHYRVDKMEHIEPCEENSFYLKTKKERMGHLI